MRFVELALFATPFLAFLAWRLMAPRHGPPRALLFGLTAAVLLMAGLLLGLRYEDAAPPNSAYVPARQEDGRIVPPRVNRDTPPAPR